MLKKVEGQIALGPGREMNKVATGNVIIQISQEKVAEALHSDVASDLPPPPPPTYLIKPWVFSCLLQVCLGLQQ